MRLGLTLYAVMLIAGAIQGILATDEAAKYVEPYMLWVMRSIVAVINVTATGLKAYTSEAFSQWVQAKKNGIKTGDTAFMGKI